MCCIFTLSLTLNPTAFSCCVGDEGYTHTYMDNSLTVCSEFRFDSWVIMFADIVTELPTIGKQNKYHIPSIVYSISYLRVFINSQAIQELEGGYAAASTAAAKVDICEKVWSSLK